MPESYVKRILDARIYDVARETQLDEAPLISARINNNVLIKREDLQPVFSFKIRGAFNKLRLLSDEEKARGVIAASAGNHAQGLALSAKALGVKATIVMPKTTPAIKVDAVRRRGAKVVLHGDAYDGAAAHANKLVEEQGLTYIHPFDDPDVIAGQGTVAMEILRQHPAKIDAIYIPVGGGGLCAGMAAYIKYVRPDIKVYAVEPEDAACLKLAMEKGRRATLPEVGIFADGVAVAQIGKETYRVLKDSVDGVITANADEMCAAIKDIFEDTRSIAEPAGALSLAGLKKHVAEQGWEDKTVIAIASGANTNFDRLRYISERTEIGEKREAMLTVTLPEKAGAFRKLSRAIGRRGITEFNYRYGSHEQAHVLVGVQVIDDNGRHELVAELREKGYEVCDMTDNEMAKLHVRHMVGGHAPQVENERLFSFEFPERPGAMDNFLSKTASRWNISLFHYRNHGAAYGRVLVGLQVPKEDNKELLALLDSLEYRYSEETDSEAYRYFLS
ncbi:threonine ammonia-lyase, biosynthetic [uncultured Pseudoteredinibacter sp.]|uniref:threonine ammonia-lyase, biosynthetic n=1 Tax=uncultured Pseudoteredinibacter sp. TaxID=1641701 RepID=UPI0026077B51|nr:threonine ammonia-lyase, biosynthetic [uncultured Pseudoteredinibacter sp.]